MFRYIRICSLVVSIVLLVSSCNHNKNTQYRSFYMGFSPWPYDNTTQAVDWVYSEVTTEGDIISHHLEEGVPWPEAYADTSFSQSYIDEIQSRLQRKVNGQKTLLQINPLNVNRDGMALYRGDSINMSLPAGWTNLNLDDAKVKTAYLNYAKRMVDYFNPDYMLLGVEANLLIRNNPNLWPHYIELQKYVYTELKTLYPSLELSVSVFCVPYFPEWSSVDDLQAQLNGLNDLTPYVDFLSFSVHPFMSGLLAESFPDDYFQRLFAITSKPIAIAESSYPAQFWQTTTPPILSFNGTPEKQDNFLSLMLSESQKVRAKFVIWFTIRDYDALWIHALNQDPSALPWRDTGLYDEAGVERKTFSTWRTWHSYGYLP